MGQERGALRVLAVDDDPLFRELLVELLAQAGCRVLTACDGAEATEILASQPVDVLITDYEMPRLNGLGLIRWSRTHFPGLSTVMITGQNSHAVAAEAREWGALRVLSKPVTVEHLSSLLREIRAILSSP